ncbi:Sodium/hydrogen exchanger 3 [Schistosoma japonicum]|nr:Sodium/hydrogen exchanger 3 [Schistosoma japonicum]
MKFNTLLLYIINTIIIIIIICIYAIECNENHIKQLINSNHNNNNTHSNNNNNINEEYENEIVVVKWKFHEFEIHIAVMIFLLVMILIKMAYHRVPYLSLYLPESFVLIVIGIIFGAIVRYGIEKGVTKKSVWKLTPGLFFTYLLPPIVLESAYSLYNRTFSEYLGVVLIFAVLGTIFNFLIIGFIMYGIYIIGGFGQPLLDMDVKSFLLFSSLIVAVDPVAVLAIFQDIGVELGLYYIVFGESLLNDAVTVVLYDIMDAFTGKEIVTGREIGIGIASFFTVSFGGLFIGVIYGIITCLITRIKSRLNAFTLLLLAYFSYIMADCVGWSGIISMIGCGLVQAAYAFHNLDRHSITMVRNLTKVVSEMSESVIFLFLGIEVVSTKLVWHTGYILWALVWCLIARAVVVFGITAIVNSIPFSNTHISFTQQIVLIYGGLRGAVAFSLSVLILPSKLGPNGVYNRELIVTTTLFIILFTVGFMGITMKPLVKLLRIRMENKQKLSLFDSLNDSIIDETLAGIESLVGSIGRNAMRDLILRLDERYLRRVLQREPDVYDQKMLKVYEKIALKMHHATMRPSKTEIILKDLPETLKTRFITSHISTVSIPGLITGNLSTLNLSSMTKSDLTNNLLDTSELSRDIESNGNNNLTRRRLSTITTDSCTTPDVKQALRYSRRPSLAPKQKRQLDFDEAFLDVMKSRSLALKHLKRSTIDNTNNLLTNSNGKQNQAYLNEEEEVAEDDSEEDFINKLKALNKAEQNEEAGEEDLKDKLSNNDDGDRDQNDQNDENDENAMKSVKFSVDTDDLSKNFHRL